MTKGQLSPTVGPALPSTGLVHLMLKINKKAVWQWTDLLPIRQESGFHRVIHGSPEHLQNVQMFFFCTRPVVVCIKITKKEGLFRTDPGPHPQLPILWDSVPLPAPQGCWCCCREPHWRTHGLDLILHLNSSCPFLLAVSSPSADMAFSTETTYWARKPNPRHSEKMRRAHSLIARLSVNSLSLLGWALMAAWPWPFPQKADNVFWAALSGMSAAGIKDRTCVCMCACFKAIFCHTYKYKWSPVFAAPSPQSSFACPPHSRLLASRSPRSRISIVHLYGNDSCLSRSTWEASLAAVTSMPFPRLSFSGVSTTHCSKICSDMNQAASWLLLPWTPLRPTPMAAALRPGFVSPNYLFVTWKPGVSRRYCGGIFGLMHRQKA